MLSATEILLIVAAAIGLASVALVLVSPNPRRRELMTRLKQYEGYEGGGQLDEEVKDSFWHRTFRSLLDRMGTKLQSSISSSTLADLEEQIDLAGKPRGITAVNFIALQAIGLVVGVIGGILLGIYVLAVDVGPLIVLALLGGASGFQAPKFWLKRKFAARRLEIIEAMPNSLDLLTLSVEAGLAFDGALMRVAEKYRNALSDEISTVLAEMKLGRSRKDALAAMSERLDIEEMSSFVTAITQSTELGAGMGETLRIQSEDMRRRRRQRAEEKGNQAPLKMLLPMVGCIFPSLFVVLLGPAAIQLVHQFSQSGP